MYSLRACDPQLESLDTTLRYIIIQKQLARNLYGSFLRDLDLNFRPKFARQALSPRYPAGAYRAAIGESIVSEDAERDFATNGTEFRVSSTMISSSSR